MKDNETRNLVNAITDTAKAYSSTEQLRERMADYIIPLTSEITALRAEIERLRVGIADEARNCRDVGRPTMAKRLSRLLRPKPAAPPPTAG